MQGAKADSVTIAPYWRGGDGATTDKMVDIDNQLFIDDEFMINNGVVRMIVDDAECV